MSVTGVTQHRTQVCSSLLWKSVDIDEGVGPKSIGKTKIWAKETRPLPYAGLHLPLSDLHRVRQSCFHIRASRVIQTLVHESLVQQRGNGGGKGAGS